MACHCCVRPTAGLLVFGRMIQARAEGVNLALGGLETITQGQHHVGMSVIAVWLMRGNDRLVTGDADLDPDMKELWARSPSCRSFHNNASVRKSIEVTLQSFELFADAGFNRIASLEAVKRDLEWCQHSRTLSS